MHAWHDVPRRRDLRERFLAVIFIPLATAIALAANAGCMAEEQPTRTVADVLRAHTAQLMTIPGVVGTGEGEIRGEPAVVVMVSRRTPEVNSRVPHRLEGYPVQVKVVGEVRARPEGKRDAG